MSHQPSPLRQKVFLILLVTVIYLLFTLFTAVLGSFAAVGYLKRQQFIAASYSASVARGGVLALRTFCLFQCKSEFDAWNNGLRLIQQSKTLQFQLLELKKKYQFGKFTQQDLQPLKEELKLSQLTVEEIWQDIQTSTMFQQLPSDSKSSLQDRYQTLQFVFDQVLIVIDHYDELFSGEKKYLLLFQNNYELRPTGGFLGSYATLDFKDGVLSKLEIQDIYVPDGQLKGHVDPPLPIQQAFQQGFWNLRDANWHPDFPRSVENVEWFFQQSVGQEFDGVAAVQYTLIPELMNIVGELYLPDQEMTINTQNVYGFLQRTDDVFFPGSTKKRDTLAAFSKYLTLKIQALSPSQYLGLAELAKKSLVEKDVMLYLKQQPLQKYIDEQHWSGRFQNPECQADNCFADYFSITDSNMSVNKSNCCVNRSVHLEKVLEPTQVTTTSRITYFTTPPTGEFTKTAGSYKAFVRVYFPSSTQIQSLLINNTSYGEYIQSLRSRQLVSEITPAFFTQDTVGSFSEVGFWIYNEVGQTIEVALTTSTQMAQSPNAHQLTLQKQPGTLEQYNQFSVTLNGSEIFDDALMKDEVFISQLAASIQ